MPALTVSGIFETIGRDPTELIGVEESDVVDFKGEPYHLAGPGSDRACFELAKDVSAFANNLGGVIVLGVRTVPDPNRFIDVADDLRPIKPGIVDPRQIASVIHAWVVPRIDAEIKRHAIPGTDAELWTILIDRQDTRSQPFIVSRAFLSEGDQQPKSNLFSVYKRQRGENVPYAPSEVQHWMSRGLNELAERTPAENLNRTDPDSTLHAGVESLGYPKGAAYYFLQAQTLRTGSVRGFHRGSDNSLYDRLMALRHIREHGFNLPDRREPTLAENGLRVTWPGEDSLSATRDGLVTAVQGQNHLTWASHQYAPNDEAWINPLSLVEFTLEFFRFVFEEVIPRAVGQLDVRWRLGMEGLESPKPVALPDKPFPSRSVFRPMGRASRAAAGSFRTTWIGARSDAPQTAFLALTEVYAQFGLGEGLIPYQNNGAISIDAVRQQG